MITIKQVAKMAGVSIAAVSYALNGKDGISKIKADRIIKIAEEMGYVPNALARNLINNKTGIIGVVVPNISNIYTSNFISHLEHHARDNGLYLMLGSTQSSFDKEKQVIKSFIAQKVDGLIISPANYYDENMYSEIVEYINKCGTPFCLTNLSFPNIKCNYVVPDLEGGAYEITKYALKNGVKDVYFAGGTREHYYSYIRFKGFCKALDEQGITCDVDRYIEYQGEYDFDQGYEISKMLGKFKKLPQAIVAVNDLVAYGIIEGLKQIGITVPKDISITGFDNIKLPIKMGYSLTTANIPLDDMARLCIEILQNINDQNSLKQYVIAPNIIKGETT